MATKLTDESFDIPAGPLVIAHGGVGGRVEWQDGCQRAADRGAGVLAEGRTAREAALEAVRSMEADGRFDAGYGSYLRLDGRTIECDAAIMDEAGDFRAVAGVREVPHVVLLADRLRETPARILVGEGATQFARRHGLHEPFLASVNARRRWREMAVLAAEGRLAEEYAPWGRFDLARHWNFETPVPDFRAAIRQDSPTDGASTGSTGGPRVHDTVGALARDGRGGFAAATSTGGTSLMLAGRVGDCPLPGCGLFVGPGIAVTVTGEGEEIMTRLLSRTVHDRIREGSTPAQACREGLKALPPGIDVGALAIDETAAAHRASRRMPVAWSTPSENPDD